MQTATDVVQLSLVLPEELSAPPGVLKKARQAWKRAWEKLKRPVQTAVSTARDVLRAIYRHLGGKLHCWPSQATLAEELGLSTRTVGRQLKQLEEAGWIKRDKRKDPRWGQLSDYIHIQVPERLREKLGQVALFLGPPPRQDVGGPLTKSPTNNLSQEASEHSSSAACAREAGPRQSQPAAAPKPAKRAAARQEGKEPVLGYVRDLLALWRELVPPLRERYGRHWKGVGAPCASWLSAFAPAHLEEAFARLLVRIQSGRCSSSPRGLYKALVLAVGQDVEEPQRHSADRLRAMIHKPLERGEAQDHAGQGADVGVVALPARPASSAPASPARPARSVEPAPPPPAPEKREPGRQASQKCAAPDRVERSGSAGSGQAGQRAASSLSSGTVPSGRAPQTRRLTGAQVFAREEEYFKRARQVMRGLGPAQWEEACRALLDVCAQGLCSKDAAARAMSAMWSWEHSVCLGLLLEKARSMGVRP